MQNMPPAKRPYVRVVSGSVAKQVTTVRLDEDLRARLRVDAEARGISEAEVIRQAIVFYLGWLHAQETTKPPTTKE